MKLLPTAFLILLMFALSACGCPTREVTQQVSQFESYQVTVTDPALSSFTVDIIPDQTFPGFQVISAYIHQNKPAPSNIISFKFFFRSTALPGGEDIFDQSAGGVFIIPETPYVEEDVIYFERSPQPPDFIIGPNFTPTSYSGTVSITDPNHVQFDLTFTDGTESRKIHSVFFFQTATFDQPIGECEP